jgi:hypothetical protein
MSNDVYRSGASLKLFRSETSYKSDNFDNTPPVPHPNFDSFREKGGRGVLKSQTLEMPTSKFAKSVSLTKLQVLLTYLHPPT